MSIEENLKIAEGVWLNVKLKSFPYLVGCIVFFILLTSLLGLFYFRSLKDAEKNRLANKALENEIVLKDRDLKKLHAENDAKSKAYAESVKKYEASIVALSNVAGFYTNGSWRDIAKSYELRTGKN
jgi:hypothetical protein